MFDEASPPPGPGPDPKARRRDQQEREQRERQEREQQPPAPGHAVRRLELRSVSRGAHTQTCTGLQVLELT